jgi:hypothetical protein
MYCLVGVLHLLYICIYIYICYEPVHHMLHYIVLRRYILIHIYICAHYVPLFVSVHSIYMYAMYFISYVCHMSTLCKPVKCIGLLHALCNLFMTYVICVGHMYIMSDVCFTCWIHVARMFHACHMYGRCVP